MSYVFNNNEANFGPPLKHDVWGGTHITFEIILKFASKYVALRRPNAIPHHEHPPKERTKKGYLYFCHGLIRYGETVQECVSRIVKEQTDVHVKSYKIVDIDSSVQEKDNQWAFTPHIIAELKDLPTKGSYGNEITKVVLFTKDTIPDDFGWWEKDDLKEFLEEFD